MIELRNNLKLVNIKIFYVKVILVCDARRSRNRDTVRRGAPAANDIVFARGQHGDHTMNGTTDTTIQFGL